MKSTEKNFIRRLKRKKEDAIEYVVDTYLPIVKAVVYKVLGPLQTDADIDECISDVFLSVWENGDQFEGGPADFKKWICMVAKYKAIDQYRRVGKKEIENRGWIICHSSVKPISPVLSSRKKSRKSCWSR